MQFIPVRVNRIIEEPWLPRREQKKSQRLSSRTKLVENKDTLFKSALLFDREINIVVECQNDIRDIIGYPSVRGVIHKL